METNGLILFGKHPAWSDHMFVTFDAEIGRHLKHVFYDHSVIPALQGGDGDQRIPETWNFLVSVESRIFCMVSVPSRDSVGRSRFPLMVACPLPRDLQLEAASVELNALAHELRELLRDMLDFSEDNPDQWQAEVNAKAKAFKSKVDWSSVDSSDTSENLPRKMLASLMTRLLDEHDALSLKSCSFVEACGLFLAGLKQFKSPAPALLLFEQEGQPDALFFASTKVDSFNLKRRLYGNLPPLSVSAGNVLPKVDRLLKSSAAEPDGMFSARDVPSLKLDENRNPSSRKPFFLAILLALIASILIGFFLGRTDDAPCPVSEEDKAQIESAREKWSENAISYIKWVKPLSQHVTEQPTQISDFESVVGNLKLDLNPFSIVGESVPSLELAKNPPDQIHDVDSIDKLNKVYDNIDQLRASLIAYYEQQFTNPFPAKLEKLGYSVSKIVEVDFSQQPLRPEFSSQLVQQLDACTRSRNTLAELSAAITDLERLVVEPLYKACPEHAKLIRDYVQGLVKGSTSLKQFQEQYDQLLQTLDYPEFIEMDSLDLDALSADAEWLDLPKQTPSLQLIDKLMDRLRTHRKRQASAQIIDSDRPDLKLPIQHPDVKLAGLSPDLFSQEFDQFNDQRLVSSMRDHIEALRSSATEYSNLTDTAETMLSLQEQVEELFAAFRCLDTAFMPEISELHQSYLEYENGAEHLADFIFSRYQALSPELGNLKSVTQAVEEISLEVDAHLVALNEKLNELEIDYISSQAGVSDAVQFRQQIEELAKNPLYFEGVLGSRLNIPETTTAKDLITQKTESALLGHIQRLISEVEIDAPKLASITEAFNDLDQADISSELQDSIRLVFDKYVQQLRLAGAEGILPIYAELANYLPESMHTPEDAAYAQIAAYWNRYNSISNPGTAEKKELEQLASATESPVARQFFEQLLAMSEKSEQQGAGAGQGKLDVSVEGIHEIYLYEDRSRLEITFDGNDKKLVLLPVKTKTGEIFVQQSPLSLKQYIHLSNLCGMDTEYYLTLQDSLWPRCFEVGMGQSFHALNQWQFRNGDLFASIEPFSANTLPAHLNEPREILRLAEYFGFRFLRPEECADFFRFADGSAPSTIQMSTEDQKNIKYFNAVQSSVYADLIADSIEQGIWSGGIDFERDASGEKQFSDIVGGSAELVYDGTDFYAFGGSWLYAPSDPVKPVRIAKPKQMYLDLGIRFVADMSESTPYGELVQELALQFLNSEN